MWDPRGFNEKIRHKNLMMKKFERANDIVKRITLEKVANKFEIISNQRNVSLSVIGSNSATPKNKQIKIYVTQYKDPILDVDRTPMSNH
jgi:hypothetical protein